MLIFIHDRVRDLILQRKPASMIRKVARETQDMKTIREDGVDKVLKGITTIDEVNKVSFELEEQTIED